MHKNDIPNITKEYLIEKYSLTKDPIPNRNNVKPNMYSPYRPGLHLGGSLVNESNLSKLDKYRLKISQVFLILKDLNLKIKWNREPTKDNMDIFVMWLKKHDLYYYANDFFVNGFLISTRQMIMFDNEKHDPSFETYLKIIDNYYYVKDEYDICENSVIDYSYVNIDKLSKYIKYKLK